MLPVTKMHGLGNSYVIVDDREQRLSGIYPTLARALSDKSYGIGSDGILVINNGKAAPYHMRVFNPDGSEAEMCGNGVRMFMRYLFDRRLTDRRELMIEVGGSQGGRIVTPKLNPDNSVTVDMGTGMVLEDRKIVVLPQLSFVGKYVSVGNPHFVTFTSASEDLARKYGPLIENHPDFQPNRTNVEFAEVKSRGEILLHVWERGAGYTSACGTGACAAAFAARVDNRVDGSVRVRLPGGYLNIEVTPPDLISMTGPAEYILRGEIDLDSLLKHFR